MIELPSAQAANLGLGSKKQFRARAGPDMSDRSSWTDTPADKAKKREDKVLLIVIIENIYIEDNICFSDKYLFYITVSSFN